MARIGLKKRIVVAPSELGPQHIRRIEQLLNRAVLGTKVPDYGTVLAVVDILGADQLKRNGRILDTGEVVFDVEYVALVFTIIPGIVVEGVVTEVRSDAVIADIGHGKVYVSQLQMPEDYTHESDGGGVQSRFVSGDGAQTISVGTLLRLKLLAETPNKEGCMAIGTISGSGFLGPRL